MSEAIQFWLDNKISTGIKVAGIDDQLLVLYRDKFYLVEKGAARMGGRKALRYSKSSLPSIWKKALSGDAAAGVSDAETPFQVPALEPQIIEGGVNESEPRPAGLETSKRGNPDPVRPPAQPQAKRGSSPLRTTSKLEKMPAAASEIVARCPYCGTEHRLSPEKGRIGKSFFLECDRCKADFAVRIVPVMIYQAQVAGFR